MSDEITHLMTAWIAAWNSHDLDRLAQLYAEDYEGVDVAYATPRRGRTEILETMSRYLVAFPDLYLTVESLVVQDNKAALAWIGGGTHLSKVMNIPATHRKIEIRGSSFFTIQQGQIVHSLHIWDVAGLLRSIGLLPELQKI